MGSGQGLGFNDYGCECLDLGFFWVTGMQRMKVKVMGWSARVQGILHE